MPTLVQNLLSLSFAGSNDITFTNVQVGDTLIVMGMSFNGPSASSCSDLTGNVYRGPFLSKAGGFGFMNAFCAVAQTAGTVLATVFGPGPSCVAIGLNYRGMPPFDQFSPFIGQYDPGSPSYPVGAATGPMTSADTTVVSLAWDTTGSTPGPFVISQSGDTLVYEPVSSPNIYVFQRTESGPGHSQSLFACAIAGSTNQFPVLSMSFSAPLARPAGVTEQYAFRGGIGFEAEATLIGEYKAPLVASLPYAPVLGALVAVGVSYTGCGPAITALSVGDDYGNAYTKDIATTGNSTGIALFHTVLTNLPPVGSVFQAKLSTVVSGCPGIPYQVTGIGIGEKQISSLVSVAAAGWDHDVNASPNQTLVSAVISSVPASTWLFAMAAYGPTANQTNIGWTPLESYALQQQQNFIQFPFALANGPKVGPGAIFTKFVAIPGNYDTQAIATQTGPYAEAGSIALLAATVILPPATPLGFACPVDGGTATVGVPYAVTLSASGGVEPYVYEFLSGPPWLTLTSNVLSGVPTATGDFSYSVKVTDAISAEITITCDIHSHTPQGGCVTFSLLTPAPGVPGGGGSNTCAITGPYRSLLGGPVPVIGTGAGDDTPQPPEPPGPPPPT